MKGIQITLANFHCHLAMSSGTSSSSNTQSALLKQLPLLAAAALASPQIFNYVGAGGAGNNLQVKAAEKTLKHPTHSPLA